MTHQNENSTHDKFEFQAEVSRVMDIVINSLYTDREIFVRELISNAVDALEKMRHLTLIEEKIEDKDKPLEIAIDLDEEKKIFKISDTGIGMIREELISDLGKIAHSGSKEFFEQLADQLTKDVSLIGQFGVGFYSVFMVANKVTVQTKSYLPLSGGYEWVSQGADGFTINEVENVPRGTTIIIELKDDADDFCKEATIKRIIKKYSNFVPFPILLKNEKVNTIQAIWTRNKSEIGKEEYSEFYKYIAGAFDDPMDILHFSTDAPLAVNALLFIPKENIERLGFGKIEPGIDLHCRKVLIEKQAHDIVPQWLRFLKGVVDSEDLPLNISRETMQDSALIRRLNRAITDRFIKFLEENSHKDKESYETFWKTFGTFIKEGIISGPEHREKLASLLRYESSKTEPGELSSLEDYIERMKDDQKEIYFMTGTDRQTLSSSPYLEVFSDHDIEVIYTFDPADDFVMTHLSKYKDYELISAESARIDLPKKEDDSKPETQKDGASQLTDKEKDELRDWMKKVLKDKIADVRISKRLVGSPVILVNPDSHVTGAMQRILEAVNKDFSTVSKLTLEFNPDHKLIKQIDQKRHQDSLFAETILEQLLDQSAFSAGYTVQPTSMIERMNNIMERALSESDAHGSDQS